MYFTLFLKKAPWEATGRFKKWDKTVLSSGCVINNCVGRVPFRLEGTFTHLLFDPYSRADG